MQLDPQASRQILEAVLTLAGGTVAAAIIAAIIQIAKTVPTFGAWLENGHEYLASLVLSAILVVYAAVAIGYALDLVSGFGLFLAWLGLAAIVGKAYDAGAKVVAAT